MPDLVPGQPTRVECGIDLVEVQRIGALLARYGPRFLARVWTEREQEICGGRWPELAARFAGKEATMKALGTGISGLGWREVEILRDVRGKPLLLLHGMAAERATHLGVIEWSVSLTHTQGLAGAVAVALIAE